MIATTTTAVNYIKSIISSIYNGLIYKFRNILNTNTYIKFNAGTWIMYHNWLYTLINIDNSNVTLTTRYNGHWLEVLQNLKLIHKHTQTQFVRFANLHYWCANYVHLVCVTGKKRPPVRCESGHSQARVRNNEYRNIFNKYPPICFLLFAPNE